MTGDSILLLLLESSEGNCQNGNAELRLCDEKLWERRPKPSSRSASSLLELPSPQLRRDHVTNTKTALLQLYQNTDRKSKQRLSV